MKTVRNERINTRKYEKRKGIYSERGSCIRRRSSGHDKKLGRKKERRRGERKQWKMEISKKKQEERKDVCGEEEGFIRRGIEDRKGKGRRI